MTTVYRPALAVHDRWMSAQLINWADMTCAWWTSIQSINWTDTYCPPKKTCAWVVVPCDTAAIPLARELYFLLLHNATAHERLQDSLWCYLPPGTFCYFNSWLMQVSLVGKRRLSEFTAGTRQELRQALRCRKSD